MDYGKYIIVNETTPILFPCHVEHWEMAKPFGGKADSGGQFSVDIKDGKIVVSTFGRSVTLKVDSKKEDAKYIKRLLDPYSYY